MELDEALVFGPRSLPELCVDRRGGQSISVVGFVATWFSLNLLIILRFLTAGGSEAALGTFKIFEWGTWNIGIPGNCSSSKITSR